MWLSRAPRNARVGYLELVSASGGEVLYREFIEGLQRQGYVEGRNITFRIRVNDEKDLVGEGTHERVVVNVERFDKRVQEKARGA